MHIAVASVINNYSVHWPFVETYLCHWKYFTKWHSWTSSCLLSWNQGKEVKAKKCLAYIICKKGGHQHNHLLLSQLRGHDIYYFFYQWSCGHIAIIRRTMTSYKTDQMCNSNLFRADNDSMNALKPKGRVIFPRSPYAFRSFNAIYDC